MKQHKILEDMGFGKGDIPENYCEDSKKQDKRLRKWKAERKIYGFDERETWNIDVSFAYWLLERLIRYKEINIIDLKYHKQRYNGKLITQEEAIDLMIKNLEIYLKADDFERDENDKSIKEKAWKEACTLWTDWGMFCWW